MALDQERIRFKGKAISAAIKCGGSIENNEAGSFFDSLYQQWKETGLPLASAEPWLLDRLRNTFKSIGSPPKWIQDEPTWPFVDGKPMVFFGQFSMEDDEFSNRELSPGETVYLFGGRKTEGGKTRMTYCTVSQYAKGS
jgi:hypothetical protein